MIVIPYLLQKVTLYMTLQKEHTRRSTVTTFPGLCPVHLVPVSWSSVHFPVIIYNEETALSELCDPRSVTLVSVILWHRSIEIYGYWVSFWGPTNLQLVSSVSVVFCGLSSLKVLSWNKTLTVGRVGRHRPNGEFCWWKIQGSHFSS